MSSRHLLRGGFVCAMTLCLLVSGLMTRTLAQQTPGGTVISNTANASYSDGSTTYNTSSNTITTTVANVAGLTITPDSGTTSNIVPGQKTTLPFTLTNTGNFAQGILFPASGAGVVVTGSVTVQRAVIDVDGSGTFTAGDIDIFTNASAVTSSNVALNGGTLTVLVEVLGGGTPGAVTVALGDTTTGTGFDNQAATNSANEVKTADATAANGRREAKGDYSFSVIGDAVLQANLTVPAGPIAIGGTISYGAQLCNTSSTSVAQSTTMTLSGGGTSTGVFMIFPIPVGTTLVGGQTFTGATQVLYSTTSLATAPLSVTDWTTTQPAPLSSITRVALKIGATLAASACSATIPIDVTVNSGINTSNPIVAIMDGFANNNASTPAVITDQSGDTTAGRGDGNANFTEPTGTNPPGAGTNPTGGMTTPTTISSTGAVLNGTSGTAGATGPDGTTATDFTSLGVNTGIAGVAPGGTTTAPNTSTFTNTLQNTGTGNDTFTLSVPNAAALFAALPAGATVVITTSAGSVTLSSSNTTGTVTLPLAFGTSGNYTVQVNLPTGTTVLPTAVGGTPTANGGYDVIVQATSTNTPAVSNLTRDTVYTGFLRLNKTATISNPDLTKGGPTDPVPGAEITYTITYTNISTAGTGGSGNVTLSASSIVISEDGNAAPNNWGPNTTQVLSPAPTDSNTGVITDGNTNGAVTGTSTFLKDTVPGTLAPGASGTFTFRRTIK